MTDAEQQPVTSATERAVPVGDPRRARAAGRLRRLVWASHYMLRRALGDSALGDGLVGRIAFAGAHITFVANEVFLPRARAERLLPLRLAGRRRHVWVGDRTELFALADIFLGGEYEDLVTTDPRVIVDLGANIGAATLYFTARFPDARIYAVEPDPDTARRLRRNVGALPNVEVVQCAVGGRTGRALFEQSPRSSASRLGTVRHAGGVEVDLYSFDDLLDRFGLDHVDVLKIDVEGAEFELLEHASRLCDVDEVVGELHLDHPDARPDVQRWLDSIATRAGLSAAGVHHDVFVLRRPR